MSDRTHTVAVFGANGPTGRLLVEQLLDQGWGVRAITRHPDAIQAGKFGLEVVRADATDPVQVAEVLPGSDAVVSVLGTKYSRQPITLYSSFTRAIVDAMHAQGIRRLVVTSSMAASEWRDPELNWLERAVITRILERIGATLYDDMRRMEHIVAGSGLDWTIMRPLGLASMESTTEYAIARDYIAGKQTARRDLAAAIADQLGRADYVNAAVAVATTNRTQSIPATVWREGIKPNLLGRNQ